METLVLQEGAQATVYFREGMFRSDIEGRHYCAPTRDILVRCISECHNSVIPEAPPEPVIPLADLMFKQIKTGPLEMKQSARRRLMQLAEAGDEDALGYLGRLPDKQLSFQAKYLAKSLGRDFIDLTFQDFSANVHDLVLR